MVSKGDYCDASEQGHQANAQERTSSVGSAFGSKSKHSGYNIGDDYGDFRSNSFVSKKCYKRNSYSRGGICRNNKSVNDNWRCHKSQDNGRFIKNQGCNNSSMFGDYKSKNPKLELASSWTRDVNKSKEALEELQHKQQNNIKVESQVGKSCGGLDQFRTSLYVSDLHVDVTDSQLYGIFSHFGQVVSASVCTDFTSHKSLCFGYVSYSNPKDASRALEVLNFTPFNGKPIHIVYPHQDPSILKSGAKGLFIMNLDKSIDDMVLQTIFSSFGNIVICKVAANASGLSKGYGQIEYDSEQAMQKAIENMNGAVLNRKEVFLRPF
ncbi:unnamed protein product [Cuscuta epithymum]|uniref:RRM domain-containing protein n=1 Tax=Cuscuta epithymum TaxID=186058 RepID=A0AAV0F0D7_9ASTE|nr:unnamed protein product [Cuscuta epithymum]